MDIFTKEILSVHTISLFLASLVLFTDEYSDHFLHSYLHFVLVFYTLMLTREIYFYFLLKSGFAFSTSCLEDHEKIRLAITGSIGFMLEDRCYICYFSEKTQSFSVYRIFAEGYTEEITSIYSDGKHAVLGLHPEEHSKRLVIIP